MTSIKKSYVLLADGDVMPYVEGKDYGQFVYRVWEAEPGYIPPFTKEERKASLSRELRNKRSSDHEQFKTSNP